MLEFYYTYCRKNFRSKSIHLANEISSILNQENLEILTTDEIQIPEEYKTIITRTLFNKLNNLYYTIRKNKGRYHPLLKKYLPECKKEPDPHHLLFADFFSGAGGLSQGLIKAGFQPAFVNDKFTQALETYYFNHTLPLSHFYNGNIQDLVDNFPQYKKLFSNVKIIVGGPPCQGFSTANRWNFEIDEESNEKRFIQDERNVLYKYYVKLIGLIKPDFFIMENVRGMMNVEKQIEEDIQRETNNKYSFIPMILDAQNFNIPQSRIRYILIGGKDHNFLKEVEQRILKKKTSVSKYQLKDALQGLPPIGTNPFKLKIGYEDNNTGYVIRKGRVKQNEFLKEINQGKESEYLFNHKSRYNNENDIEIFKLLPEGGNSLHNSINHLNKYKNRDHIFKDKYYKLKRNEVSKTITSHMKYDCHMYIHPEQARGISPREAARIQTFPDDYVFRGSLNDWYKQIGNAVPVKLSEIIAKELIKYYK